MRRQYAGGAKEAQLTAQLGGSTANLTITCDDLTNWPDGSVGPFYVVIDRGNTSEEKILCSSRSGNVITVYNVGLTNGRGSDDTTITSHSSGAVIEHVFTATDADEANEHVNATSNVHGVTGSIVGATSTQTLTNKTLTAPTINNAAIDNAAITNSTFSGTTITGTSVTITGSQTLADYRARNVYAATAAPTAGTGNDGDMWVQYEA